MAKHFSHKKAIIIIGPPGSGKGTQAQLTAQHYDAIHFDMGRYLEGLFYSEEKSKNDPQLQKEKKNFETGELVSPPFVLNVLQQKILNYSNANVSVIFSGNPRTVYETIGDDKTPGVCNVLEAAYGKEHVVVFHFIVAGQTSVERNSTRKICSVCATPLLGILKLDLAQCPFCGGILRTRTLDKPDVIEERLREYEKQTLPVIGEIQKRGYAVHQIDAAPMPFEVFASIQSVLDAQI